jgi:hypothetical protein
VIEKIEKHASHFETHGICEKMNPENERGNAAGGAVASGGVNGMQGVLLMQHDHQLYSLAF